MEKLIFDSGMREFGLPGGILRFNPSDPNVYARYMESTEKIKAVENEQAQKAREIDPGSPDASEKVLSVMRETDIKIKRILGDIFGAGNDFDVLLEGVNLMAVATNGERVVTNLINALHPIMEDGAKMCVNTEVGAAKLNRAQRRAMQ